MSAAAHLHATDARSGRRRREIDRSQPCESEIASIRVMLHRATLWLLACTSAALTPLESARLRSGSEARKAFAAEVARPKPDDLAIAIRDIMYATHTFDHRLIDGELGSKFLKHVTNTLQTMDPEALF